MHFNYSINFNQFDYCEVSAYNDLQMQKNISFGVIGLIIGLAVGFFAANTINRKEISQQDTTINRTNAPFVGQQTQTVSVKPNENNRRKDRRNAAGSFRHT